MSRSLDVVFDSGLNFWYFILMLNLTWSDAWVKHLLSQAFSDRFDKFGLY